MDYLVTPLEQMRGLRRMVRTPLARRIPGNDKLNSVDCLLPFFDRAAVKAVADALMAWKEFGEAERLATDAGQPGGIVMGKRDREMVQRRALVARHGVPGDPSQGGPDRDAGG